MNRDDGFHPDWASAPGDTITDILDERDISEDSFTELMDWRREDIADLLQGRATITISTARQLSQVLGASLEFWMSRDFHFRQNIVRLNQNGQEWISRLPLSDMISFGWLERTPHPADELEVCLQYFNVSNVSEWNSNYQALERAAAFRTSPSYASRTESVATWLRQGELQSETIDCSYWDPGQFQDSLQYVRELTRQKDPTRFIPRLQDICSQSGVAVVVIRAPTGCRASGAARFLSENKALLQLSSRYLTDDHFWFTFFHEAGHLLLPSQKSLYLDSLEDADTCLIEYSDKAYTSREEEANQFAARALVPEEFKQRLMELRPQSMTIARLAMQIGTSPGIVVGQLQHQGRIPYSHMNLLKRRFMWEGNTLVSRGKE